MQYKKFSYETDRHLKNEALFEKKKEERKKRLKYLASFNNRRKIRN